MSDESGSEDDRRDAREEDSDEEEAKRDKRKKPAAASDDDDDEDDDDDDDDDDGKHKSGKRSRYVDDMAGDSDDDEEEEEERRSKKRPKSKQDYEDDMDDEEAEINDDEAAQLMNDIDQRKNRGPAWLHDDMTDQDFRMRYKQDDDENAPEDENRRNARLPDATKDPKVWCVKVANGTERQIVLQLINKFAIEAKRGRPIHVTSAYCNEQALGFVYVEAFKEAYVREALSGLRGVYMTKMKLVPVKEMVDTVTVLKKKLTAQEGSWARCRRGKYKGDICQVLSTDSNRNEVEVKLVPRVDTNDYSEFDEAEQKKRRAKSIPPRRLFDPSNHKEEDLEKWGIEKERDIAGWGRGDIMYTYEGMRFNKSFLVKSFPIKSLILGSDVQPELDELKTFEQGQDEEDGVSGARPLHLTSIHKRKVVLQKGDVVRVVSGELRDLLGDVDAINNNTIIVRPRHDAIKQKLEFSLDELEKYFEQGDHVKVVGGRKEGVTGTVMHVEGEVISLLTDVNHEEIRVFSSDLQDTNEVSTGMDVVGQFQLYDLVMLEAAASSLTMPSVGVIIKLETDVLQVLDNQGKVKAVRPSDAQPQKKSATAVALDGEQQTVGQGDVVKVTDGPYKGNTGTVRHVFRAFLFLYSPSRMEHSGMFVVRSRQCTLMGQSKHTENAAPNASATGSASAMAPRGAFGDGPGGRGGGPGGPMMMGGRGMGRGRGNSWEGKRVKILKGFDKGKTGTVKEESETICRIELDATHKKVPIKKTDLVELGKAVPQVRSIPASTDAHFAAGSQTPMWTPSTPAHDGSATPNPYSEPGTPSTPRANFFDPNTPSTPMHDHQWDAGTPATPGAYQASPYDQVAATPATPGTSYGGYGSNFVATPGATLNAPTPGEAGTPATPGTWSSGGFGGGNWQGTTPYEQGTPQTPATPGSELGGPRAPTQPTNWCVPRIEVRVVSGEHIDRVGVVVELSGPDCNVQLHSTSGETESVMLPSDELEAVQPAKNSSVIILKGELKGSTGKLIGIDGRDGIVKMDKNMDIKIQDMPSLAVFVPAE